MSIRRILPVWKEVTFYEMGLDARSLVTRTDLRGVVTFASKAYREMTGFKKEEIIGRSHNLVRHPFMPRKIFEQMWTSIKEGKNFTGYIMNMRKDGTYYWVEVTIDAIDKDGNIISTLASIGHQSRISNKKDIAGYVAIRREPSRSEIREVEEYYRFLKKEELKNKVYLKDVEKELLKIL